MATRSHSSGTPKGGSLKLGIIEARDLVSADSNGKSDPYVVVRVGQTEIGKTDVQNATLTPKWNHVMDIPCPDGFLPHALDLQVSTRRCNVRLVDL